MRLITATTLGLGLVIVSGITGACSGKGSDGGSDSGASKGAASGDGTDTIDLADDNVNVGDGGAGNGNQELLDDPELTKCTTAQDCCDTVDGCTDVNSFICTVTGFCGLVGNSCEDHGDCQGDTYCCEGELCRADGSNEGVCISAAVPPGLDCGNALAVGEFAPDVQCEWTAPPAGDASPTSVHVLSTPMVMDLPYDSGAAAEIVIITAESSGVSPDKTAPGVIRILNGQDCSQQDSIKLDGDLQISALAAPALGDIDGDGVPEIVVRGEIGGKAYNVIVLEWNGTTYVKRWSDSTPTPAGNADDPWGGASLHDLNNDGKAEVLMEHQVWDNTGKKLSTDSAKFAPVWTHLIPVVADVDADGRPELIASGAGGPLWSWDDTVGWKARGGGGISADFFGVADFGTPGATPADFDFKKLDGKAEIVAVQPLTGTVTISTLDAKQGEVIMTSSFVQRDVNGAPILDKDKNEISDKGGPPVIGDFDKDGFPEIGVVGATRMRVIDPADCANGCDSVVEKNVRWSRPSQDSTSGQTGGTMFDFDGDQKAEMVYADECFLRVYEGKTGEVLFSAYRTSSTWLESPLVADVDNDQNTELVVNSNNFNIVCPEGGNGSAYVDPIHPGIKCSSNDTCPSSTTCSNDGLCVGCVTNDDCCDGLDLLDCGLTCTDRMAGDTGTGKVCRATHPGSGAQQTGVRVLRDRLDRWASSRPIWNQHAYSITNVKLDGTIPKTSDWGPNWVEDTYNNFRANVQGVAGFDDLPDITGRLADDSICVSSSTSASLRATVCNRGKRTVGAELPATFYLGDPADGNVICTSYTSGPVPTGGCAVVECELTESLSQADVTLVVNDDGTGRPKTVECRDNNNTDVLKIDMCDVVR